MEYKKGYLRDVRIRSQAPGRTGYRQTKGLEDRPWVVITSLNQL